MRGDPNTGNLISGYASVRAVGFEFSHFYKARSEFPAAVSVGLFQRRDGRLLDAMVFRDGGAFGDRFYFFGGFGIKVGQATGLGVASRVRAGVFNRFASAGVYVEGSLGSRHSLGSVGIHIGIHL